MSTVVIDGLDSRTNSDLVKNFCQNFGRILNCYIRSNQCVVTFADQQHAEEFIRTSPHRIDSNGLVTASWQSALHRTAPPCQRSASHSNDNCRLTVRGTFEQLDENTLLRYFSQYGQIRMCQPNPSQGYATITFDDRMSCERTLKVPRHFLNGRSLVVEAYTSPDESEPSKRMKVADRIDSTFSPFNARFEQGREQSVSEQAHLQNQFQQRLQWYEYEKQQLNNLLTKQHAEFSQQLIHCQYLLRQSLDEINSKDKQIEQLKQDNKDIDDLLRQSVHDNEQQQIHARRREEVHNQTKRKYEELYKAYMKLKDNGATQRDKDFIVINDPVSSSSSMVNKSKSTIDVVKRKL